MTHDPTPAPTPARPCDPVGRETELPRCAVVVPTYNHALPLSGVLAGLERIGLPVIVVNDGSEDDTASVVESWRRVDAAGRITVRHPHNLGKAAALQTGFGRARELGFTHALTIDADGQHDPEDLRAIMAQTDRTPRAMIVGARPRRVAGCPWNSRLGRALSNFFVWLASGVRVDDSQSGLRSYPLTLVDALGIRAGRFGYETEALTKAGWAGVRVIEIPITCVYEVDGGRVSHFKVGRDSWAAVGMHARLIGRSLLPGRPTPRLGHTDDTVDWAGRAPTGTIAHRLWWWIGPRRLVEMARGDARARERFAASVATGVFMATLFVYGVKTVLCLWLSARFRLHPAMVLAVSSLSTPPVGVVFVLASLVVGHIVLNGALPSAETLPTWSSLDFADLRQFFAEWAVGSVIAGAGLAAITYVVMRAALVGRLRD